MPILLFGKIKVFMSGTTEKHKFLNNFSHTILFNIQEYDKI